MEMKPRCCCIMLITCNPQLQFFQPGLILPRCVSRLHLQYIAQCCGLQSADPGIKGSAFCPAVAKHLKATSLDGSGSQVTPMCLPIDTQGFDCFDFSLHLHIMSQHFAQSWESPVMTIFIRPTIPTPSKRLQNQHSI